MTWHFMEFTLLFLAIGSLLGSLITIFLLRRIMKSRMKSYYRLMNDVSVHSIRLRKEYKRKIDLLRYITNQFNYAEHGIPEEQFEINEEEYKAYLTGLEGLLHQLKIDFPTPKSK